VRRESGNDARHRAARDRKRAALGIEIVIGTASDLADTQAVATGKRHQRAVAADEPGRGRPVEPGQVLHFRLARRIPLELADRLREGVVRAQDHVALFR